MSIKPNWEQVWNIPAAIHRDNYGELQFDWQWHRDGMMLFCRYDSEYFRFQLWRQFVSLEEAPKVARDIVAHALRYARKSGFRLPNINTYHFDNFPTVIEYAVRQHQYAQGV